MVAERLSDDRGGGLKDELADGGGPALLGRDAEFTECVAQGGGVHGLARAAAGEEPRRVLVDGRGAGGQGLEIVEQEVGHGLRYWGGRFAEPECDVLALAKDVVDCHANDAADRLGEQQDQTGGDLNSQRGAGVGEDPVPLEKSSAQVGVMRFGPGIMSA
ncbi:hypothetical protein ACWGPD_09915 [Streptomyces hirsutus]|uniref:hypothetical protein n=1 Tax=Streptomyces hirsutus TaxID=35620 RepID=UPI00364157B8